MGLTCRGSSAKRAQQRQASRTRGRTSAQARTDGGTVRQSNRRAIILPYDTIPSKKMRPKIVWTVSKESIISRERSRSFLSPIAPYMHTYTHTHTHARARALSLSHTHTHQTVYICNTYVYGAAATLPRNILQTSSSLISAPTFVYAGDARTLAHYSRTAACAHTRSHGLLQQRHVEGRCEVHRSLRYGKATHGSSTPS